jgi:transcriptional regulator with XRE-family HTH domain
VLDIGSKIRHLRQINGLAQSDLAERAGLTKGAISQIERNLSSPSVATLFEIIAALNETPSSFFADDDEEKVLFRRSESLPSDLSGYERFGTLLPKSRRRSVTAYNAVIRPGCEPIPEQAQEGENYVFVINGRLGLRLGKAVYAARKGDSLYFGGESGFTFLNKGKSPVEFLWVKANAG